MKIEEIARIEDANEGAIILIKEGLFWRAYEQSAKRFVFLITKYQLIRKEFKALGRSMVYLGFPETRLKQVVARAKIKGWSVEEPVSGQIRISGIPSIPKFDESELTIKTIHKPDIQNPVPFTSAPFSDQILSEARQPKTDNRPPLTHDSPITDNRQPITDFGIPTAAIGNLPSVSTLPVYKDAYDLMLMLYHFTKHIDRAYRFTLGERVKNENLDLLLAIYRAQLNTNRTENIKKAMDHAEIMRLLLRLTNDLHLIELKRFIQMNQKIEDILRQLGGWSKAQRQCRSPADQGLQERAEISSMAP